MSSIQGDIGGDLKIIVAEKLTALPNFNEDVNYVAEYIVLLMSNGGDVESISQELVSLFDSVSPISLQDVVVTAFQALQMLQSGENLSNIQNSLRAPAPSVQIPQDKPKSAFEGLVDLSSSKYASTQSDYTSSTSVNKGSNKRGGGVNKSSRGNTRFNQSNPRKTNALAQALGLGEGTSNDNSITVIKKEGRCKLFPHCPLGRQCPHAHPTIVCPEYPTCKKSPGTCSFLHPDQDIELMKEIEKTRKEFRERKIALAQSRTKPIHTGIVLCKFGNLCSSPQCPFGHPTPVNEDAKVIQFIWCPNNLSCEDSQCNKAHSSLSKIREVQRVTAPKPKPPVIERSLEQCKFGIKCTNKRCRYRHARSHIMCRSGSECTRIDCLFGHPIMEPCKYAADCKTAACLFQHPPERRMPEKNLSSSTGNLGGNERPYALPEDSGIEDAPPQEQDGDSVMA